MMKSQIFGFVTLIFFVIWLITLGADNADDVSGDLELDVNGYHVRLNLAAPSHVGENEFHIYLLDLDNTPLNNVRVNLMAASVAQTNDHTASMEKNPAMAGHYILHSAQELPTPPSSGRPVDWVGNQTEMPILRPKLSIQRIIFY